MTRGSDAPRRAHSETYPDSAILPHAQAIWPRRKTPPRFFGSSNLMKLCASRPLCSFLDSRLNTFNDDTLIDIVRIEGVSSDRTRCEGSPDDTSGHPMATPLAPRSRYNSSRSSALPPSRGHMHFCSAAWKGVRHSLLVGVVPMRPLTSCSLRVETRKNLPLRCPHREVARPEARSTPPCTLVLPVQITLPHGPAGRTLPRMVRIRTARHEHH